MTRRKGVQAEQDPGMKALLDSGAKTITIVGKTSAFHATEVLRVSLEENLAMIRDTVKYLRECGREVIYDAEHFFDGWKLDPEYAAKTVRAAAEAGACLVVLCDTNGGTMPEEIAELTKAAQAALPVPVGIHCHNDCDLAVANSLAAVDAGAVQVQGTINGVGERCGNADLISVCANLAVKKSGYEVLDRRRRAAAHRTFALCLRSGEHELSLQPAVRRPKRLRPQRRHARPRRRPGHQQLRTHRARIGRQRTPNPRQRTFRPIEHRRPHRQAQSARRPSELMDRILAASRQAGKPRLSIRSRRSLVRSAGPPHRRHAISPTSKRSNTTSPSNAT